MREIQLPSAANGATAGATLTPNGRYLLVADGIGAAVISVRRAEQGLAHAVMGQLDGGAGTDAFAIDVAASPDSHFVFVSLEGAQALAVFNLEQAVADHFRRSALVGKVPMNNAPVGMAISPDGRWLYATSEIKSLNSPRQGGTLSLIDLHTAETRPSRSVLTRVNAGCGPVRVVVSSTGQVVWVAARESNRVVAYSAAKLRRDPHRARIAEVRVGEAPVGLALFRGGKRLIVADSNRFAATSKRGELSIINTQAALAGKQAVIGAIPSGSFPRDITSVPKSNLLLVTNYNSNQLELLDTRLIP